jgi:Fe-S-cluster containining protein
LVLAKRPVRCLSIHAPYACAHAGECCRAGWNIPIEEHLVAPLRAIGIDVAPGRVAPSRPNGECVFFEADAGRLCTIHKQGGMALLPSVCRHFPRVVINDPRGTSVTLSHFCPTAANLLFTGTPLSIVEAPPSLGLGGNLEGLDATDVMPPLLSEDVLMDWEGYTAWEEAAVELFNVDGSGPEQAVDRLAVLTERVRSWKPGRTSLASAIRRELGVVKQDGEWRESEWGEFARPINAFLAAHAFASWSPYGPVGLASIPVEVDAAFKTLAKKLEDRQPVSRSSLMETIRATDLELRHRA